MPEKKTLKKAQKAKKEGKSPKTQAGAFVEEQMHHIREGKHGAKNTKQAIAIGLSQARKSGVDIPDASGKKTAEGKGRISKKKVSAKRSEAAVKRLKKEPKKAASHEAISLQARRAAKERSSKDRHEAALKAARTRERNKKAA